MNIEDYREYCLSLGADVEEKLPFQKFKNGEGVLVFYVMGHMFSFFDCNDFSVISLKCQPERIENLKAQYDCIGNPYNESPKHWIGINPKTAPNDLLQELTRNSYEIVKAKYASKRGQSRACLSYAERRMRKASRQMDAAFALEVLDKAPYVTVSMTRPDGTPYGLPLSLARTDERTFYFHCALEGDKLDCIAHCPTVFLSAVTKCAPTVGPKDGSFTLQYKSATAVGKAELVTDREEKIAALRAICQRFLPHHMDAFDDAIARSLERTAVVKITLTEPPVGKRKQYDKEGEEMKYGRIE